MNPTAEKAPRTLQELAQEALQVQDACNPLGVANGYARSLVELRRRLEMDKLPNDTDAMRCHPINRLWADKIASLAGIQGDATLTTEYSQVCELAGQ